MREGLPPYSEGEEEIGKVIDMNKHQKDACAELLGELLGEISMLPTDAVGECHALALTFAYHEVQKAVSNRLRTICS